MMIFPDGKQVAIEVELTMKSKSRLNKIIQGYAVQFSISEVWYYCAPEIINKVEKAAAWLSEVSIFELK